MHRRLSGKDVRGLDAPDNSAKTKRQEGYSSLHIGDKNKRKTHTLDANQAFK